MKKYKPKLGSNKRTEKSRSLADIARPMTKKALGGHALIVRELILGWRAAVGRDIAKVTRPQSVNRARVGEACLTIAVDPGAALEIQHETATIIERINTYVGYQMIGRLRLVQQTIRPLSAPEAPMAQNPVDPAKRAHIANRVKAIRDPEARQILQEMGELLSAKQR